MYSKYISVSRRMALRSSRVERVANRVQLAERCRNSLSLLRSTFFALPRVAFARSSRRSQLPRPRFVLRRSRRPRSRPRRNRAAPRSRRNSLADLVPFLLLARGAQSASISTCSTSRARSHWPAKFATSASDAAVLEHPLTCAGKFSRSSPLVGQSHQLLVRHRRPQKIRQPRRQRIFVDERILLIVGGRVAASSMRNRNRGEASTATIARPMPASNVCARLVDRFPWPWRLTASRSCSSTGRR